MYRQNENRWPKINLKCKGDQNFKSYSLGTGGAICMKSDEGIFITPSGVLKESVRESDLFVLDEKGGILKNPDSINGKVLKYSSCFPNFINIYKHR